jgi:hypothetical protein
MLHARPARPRVLVTFWRERFIKNFLTALGTGQTTQLEASPRVPPMEEDDFSVVKFTSWTVGAIASFQTIVALPFYDLAPSARLV